MPQPKYLEIIQQSPVFQQLDKEMQETILASTGKDLEEYANIFLRAEATLSKAKEKFMAKNNEIVQTFKIKVVTIKKDKRQKDEQQSRGEEAKTEEALLQSMEEITY